MEITNLDQVIKHSAAAAKAHAHGVGNALNLVIAAEDAASRSNAAYALRIALVAQAEGHECAHDGATFRARCDAARAALEAWDASDPSS